MMDTELGAIVERVLAAEERRREAQIAFARAQIALLDRIRETMRREQARDLGGCNMVSRRSNSRS